MYQGEKAMNSEEAKQNYLEKISQDIHFLDLCEEQLNEQLIQENPDKERIQQYQNQIQEIIQTLKKDIQNLPPEKQEDYLPLIHAYERKR